MSLYTIFTIKRRLPYLGYNFQNALDTESHIQPKVRVFTTKLIRRIPYNIHAHVVDTAILSCDEQIHISHNITAINGYLYHYNAEEPRVINASSLSSEIDYIDLKSIAGEYAITHINADGVLRAFSDPERIRSLYYINNDDVFGVSTRPAMLARLAQNMSCDLEWLAAVSAIGYGIGTRTAYKKIKAVPQGATLQWDGVNIDISYNKTRRIYSNRGLASNPEYVSEQIDKSIYAVNSAIKLASTGSDDISLGITGGKDSRLLLALCLAGGLKSRLRLFTVGYPDHPDCIVGSQLAAAVGIRHEVRSPSPGAVNPYLDPSAFLDRISISSFQTNGLCGCWDMILGRKTGKSIVMSGFMGEIFKAFDKGGKFKPDTPFQGRDIVKLQSPFDPIGVLKKGSERRLSKDVVNSIKDFLNVGFYKEDLPDLFYYTNRIPNWLGNARQVQGFTGINVMPLGVPPLIDLAFFARANERTSEMIHYNIIKKLSPELLNVPFALQRWHPALGAPNRGVVGMPDRAMPVHGSWQHSINKRRDVRKAVESLVSDTESNLWKVLDRDRLVEHLRGEESNMLQMISVLGILPALYFETQTFNPTKIKTDNSNISVDEWVPLSSRRKAVLHVIDRLSSVRQVSSSKQRFDDAAVIKGARLPPEADGGIRNLQVGCGPRHIRPDWWNTDLRSFPGIDEALDATKPWRWADRLDHVYAEHFLEHLPLDGAVRFLVNAGRALRVGGHIRLSTPGLEWVMRSHFRFTEPGSSEQVMDTLQTNRAFHGWGHRFLYSRGMLQWLLESMSFVDVRFAEYGQSAVEAFRGIELHGKYAVMDGYPSVWIVEATRGAAPIGLPEAAMALLRREFLQQVEAGH